MVESELGGANREDKQTLQAGRVACFDLQALDRYFSGESSPVSEIQKHLDIGCPRCSGYLALRRESKTSAVRIRERVLHLLDEDAKANYPQLYATLKRLQSSERPEDRQAAGRLRYALNVPIVPIDFRLDQQQLHHGGIAESEVIHIGREYGFLLRVDNFESRPGDVTFVFRVQLTRSPSTPTGRPSAKTPAVFGPEGFDADLLLADNTRLPLRRERREDSWFWVSPQIAAKQLSLRAGNWFVRLEMWSSMRSDELPEQAIVGVASTSTN